MALDTVAKRRRAFRTIYGLGLTGWALLAADGVISKTDRSQIIGFYYPGITPVQPDTYLKLTRNISPPPIQTILSDDKSIMSREWQKWFYDLVRSIQETQVLIYKQNVVPTIPNGYNFALWQDTKNSNKSYFIYRRGDSDQIKVELT